MKGGGFKLCLTIQGKAIKYVIKYFFWAILYDYILAAPKLVKKLIFISQYHK